MILFVAGENMRGRWVRRPKEGTSVVFVHGIFSSGEECWKNPNGTYWPELLRNDPQLESTGIYVFTYRTGLDSGSYSVNDAAAALKEQLLSDEIIKSKRIIFVCHSMGGIVVRKYLVDREIDLMERK